MVVAGRASGGQDAANGTHFWGLDDGTGNERIRFFRALASDTARLQVTDGGVTQALRDFTFTNLTAFKSAVAWAVNDFAHSMNGQDALLDAAGTIPTVTTLGLGMTLAGAEPANGHIRRFDYYPTRQTNAFLVSASA